MYSYTIEPLTDEYASHIYDNLVPLDKIECDIGYDTKDDFITDLATADWNKVVLIDGEPVMMYGVTAYEDMFNTGIAWMLRTAGLDLARREFLRQSRNAVNEMQKDYLTLMNMVHTENKMAIKWLKFCGFTFTKHVQLIKGEPFVVFYRNKRNV